MNNLWATVKWVMFPYNMHYTIRRFDRGARSGAARRKCGEKWKNQVVGKEQAWRRKGKRRWSRWEDRVQDNHTSCGTSWTRCWSGYRSRTVRTYKDTCSYGEMCPFIAITSASFCWISGMKFADLCSTLALQTLFIVRASSLYCRTTAFIFTNFFLLVWRTG